MPTSVTTAANGRADHTAVEISNPDLVKSGHRWYKKATISSQRWQPLR